MLCSSATGQGMEFFHGKWEDALKMAQEQNKLIFVDSYTTWCGPCKRMSAQVFPKPEIGAFFNANFINVKMNMEDEQFDEVIQANLKSAFWLTRSASRHMVRARQGRIIYISSISGIRGNAGQSNYSASKAGLIGFAKSVAKELAKRNITCNVIAPGFIETDMTSVLPDAVKEGVKPLIPMRRFGKPEEIAGVVAFLAGPQASYMTGSVIMVDGGLGM